MSKIKACFRNVTDEQKQIFKESRCLLTISVGQASHEGEMFEKTIELINKYFKSCIIVVVDSLQRHTMALNNNKDANYFYKIALREGISWIERNKSFYSKLTIPHEIVRWDRWLKHSNFPFQQDQLMSLIKTDLAYKLSFDRTIESFLNKTIYRKKEGERINLEISRMHSFNYLLEECTVLCLLKELDGNFEVYPGIRNCAMAKTHRIFVKNSEHNLLEAVAIRFKNTSPLKTQTFQHIKNPEKNNE